MKTQVDTIEHRLNMMERRQSEELLRIDALPEPQTVVGSKTPRAMVNQIVRNHSQAFDIPYNEVWGKLYREFYYRCHIDIKRRAKRLQMSKLDVVEDLQMMEQLYSVAHDLLSDDS